MAAAADYSYAVSLAPVATLSRLDLERPLAPPDGHPASCSGQHNSSVHTNKTHRCPTASSVTPLALSSGALTGTCQLPLPPLGESCRGCAKHSPGQAASAMPGCYVGKATKIFLALLAFLAIVGVVLAFRAVLHRSAKSSPTSSDTDTACAAAGQCQPVLPGPAVAQPATAARPPPTPAPPQNPTFPSPGTAWPPPSPLPVTPLQPQPPSPPMLVPPPQLPPPAPVVSPPPAFPTPPPAEIASPPPPASASPPPPADLPPPPADLLLPPPPALPSPAPPDAPQAPSPTAS
ncbi:unnamed protein product [Urochloa humidicola]